MIIETEDYMNIATFARHTGHSAVWITQLIKMGKIPYVLISGVKFINYKEYDKESRSCENKDEGCGEEGEQCCEACTEK